MAFDTERFIKDRDTAFTKAVMDDDWSAVHKYMKKYGIQKPSSRKVLKGAIYKAVQECTNIPEDVKAAAAVKCLKLGMSPFAFMDDGGGHDEP